MSLLSSRHRPGPAGGRLAATGALHLLGFSKQEKYFPPDITRCEPVLQRCLSWASKKMDGSLPSPSPCPPQPSILHLMLQRTSLLILSGGCRLDVHFFYWSCYYSLPLVERSLDEGFLNVNWLAVYHEPESCYLSRESLFVEPQPAAGHQSYPSLVLISM